MGDSEKGRQGDRETGRQGDRETERQREERKRDREKGKEMRDGRQGDKETGRQGDGKRDEGATRGIPPPPFKCWDFLTFFVTSPDNQSLKKFPDMRRFYACASMMW